MGGAGMNWKMAGKQTLRGLGKTVLYILGKMDRSLDTAVKVLGIAVGIATLLAGAQGTTVLLNAVFDVQIQLLPDGMMEDIERILGQCAKYCFT